MLDPHTAIVVGAGCSYNLGVPTMFNFMDKVFDKLEERKTGGKSQGDLDDIKEFLKSVKSSAAYVRNQVLNIEELYGLADMDDDLGELGEGISRGKSAKEALNRAIYSIACPAGQDFLDEANSKQFPQIDSDFLQIKRESHTEDADYWPQGSKYTNLLAYLCLAHHKDRSESYPLFIQFNWDLALDRAIHYLAQNGLFNVMDNDGKECYCGIALEENYLKHPMIARPHGGIHWIDTQKNIVSGEGYIPFIDGKNVMLDAHLLDTHLNMPTPPQDGTNMKIVPPTWRKQADDPVFKGQWRSIKKVLGNVRRIIFIGYSLPKTDLSFRYFLSLALGDNHYCPKVYVWNPDIFKKDSEVNSNYLSLFEPLAREGRLFGIEHYFGDPACFDLERALGLGRPIKPETK